MQVKKSYDKFFEVFVVLFLSIFPLYIQFNNMKWRTTKTINYQLMKRTVYYVPRFISGRKEKEFHGDDYSGLNKVYSIWVCMDVQNYDLIKIIILNFGKKGTSHKQLNLLYLLFMDKKKTEEKEKILHEEYEIELTRNVKGAGKNERINGNVELYVKASNGRA